MNPSLGKRIGPSTSGRGCTTMQMKSRSGRRRLVSIPCSPSGTPRRPLVRHASPQRSADQGAWLNAPHPRSGSQFRGTEEGKGGRPSLGDNDVHHRDNGNDNRKDKKDSGTVAAPDSTQRSNWRWVRFGFWQNLGTGSIRS